MQIFGKTFLVSGGSSGLGAACVRALAAAGGQIVIADLNQEAGQRLQSELGKKTRFVCADVTDESKVQEAIACAVQTFGGLHGSIQCAGIALAEKVLGKAGPSSLASFARVIQVNLVGTYNVAR